MYPILGTPGLDHHITKIKTRLVKIRVASFMRYPCNHRFRYTVYSRKSNKQAYYKNKHIIPNKQSDE